MYFMAFVVAIVSIIKISLVHSVLIKCDTSDSLNFGERLYYCSAPGGVEESTVTRVPTQGITCLKDVDYGYISYGLGQSYIYFYSNCGGTFNLINPTIKSSWNAWGAWSSCSATCGIGKQTRTRACSSGNVQDCTVNAVNTVSLESKSCNTQACTTSGNGVCGVVPSKFAGYRIIGGKTAKNCQYPWMVVVYNKRKSTVCGGTILDKDHILTAAHCVVSKYYSETESPSNVRILSGSSKMPFLQSIRTIPGIFNRRVSKVTVHKDYNDDILDNDIAIIKLESSIQFDECHVPICLAKAGISAQNATGCKTMGWGTTTNFGKASPSPNLMHTDVDILSPNTCAVTYGGEYFKENIKICAGGNGHGSCQGDSGGPLLCLGSDNRYYQHGIVSGGAYKRCGNLHSFYTKVAGFLTWIEANRN